ncbi:glycosyltransferase family 4 protein [uncultured Alsobacter sp.]|uniref:glycosyltransferase family 4 protein n=1 Tax=uncultured Alsobacter sp. TaxID=1748258 RepID=UPI0025F7579C|nr:glycosyltransferase family 4 protein [uncultured Alsobacter sp.]
MSMHVVIVVDHAHINGGQAKVALDSAVGLARRGHRVTVFSAVGPIDPSLAEAGVAVECLFQQDAQTATSQWRYAGQAMWNPEAAARLKQLLDGCDPRRTVAHVHGWAKALSPSIGPVLLESPVPAVATLHEFFMVCPNGGFFDFPANTACTRAPLSAACITHNCDSRSFVHKAYRVARQSVVNGFSGLHRAFGHVITISELQYTVASPWLPQGIRWHRVPNPVSIDDPGPPDASRRGDHLLFVGRLSPEKGAAIGLEAARRAGQKVVVVGDGPDGEALQAAHPEATFLGWQKPDAVRSAMAQARALLFPSVWYEGQPLTVLEAQALGTPVLVSDICAGREAVIDGDTGLHVRSADVSAWTQAIATIAEPGVAQRMSRAAHARYWRDPLTLERHLDGLEKVYGLALADALAKAA